MATCFPPRMNLAMSPSFSDAPETSDMDLVRRCLLGDPGALRELATRMACIRGILRGIDRRFVPGLGQDDFADLEQDIATLVWQKLEFFEGRARLESWIYRFCLFQYMNTLRGVRRRHRFSEDRWPEDLAAPAMGAPSDAEIIERSLDELGPPRADVIREHYYRGRTFEEIGRHLDLPLGTVKTHFYRGMDWLRQRLTPLRREELR